MLEIAEITDRITKAGGKALLFENNGTRFPLLINAFGSDKRMAMALGMNDISEAGKEIEEIFNLFTETPAGLPGKIKRLPEIFEDRRLSPCPQERKRSLPASHNPESGS